MNLLLLGNFGWNVLGHQPETAQKEPGGLALTIQAISSVLSGEDRLFPISQIEENQFEYAISQLSRLPNVNISGIRPSASKNYLRWIYGSDNYLKKTELESSLPSAEYSYTFPESVEGILVSFYSGNEWDQVNLSKLKTTCPKSILHVDMNRAIYFWVKSGNTKNHLEQKLTEIFSQATSIQISQVDLQLLMMKTELTEKEIVKKAIVEGQVSFFIITKQQRGLTVYEKEFPLAIKTHVMRPKAVYDPLFSYGSGDVFSGVFLVELIKTEGLKPAIMKAMKMAELAASKKTFSAKTEHLRINGAMI